MLLKKVHKDCQHDQVEINQINNKLKPMEWMNQMINKVSLMKICKKETKKSLKHFKLINSNKFDNKFKFCKLHVKFVK